MLKRVLGALLERRKKVLPGLVVLALLAGLAVSIFVHSAQADFFTGCGYGYNSSGSGFGYGTGIGYGYGYGLNGTFGYGYGNQVCPPAPTTTTSTTTTSTTTTTVPPRKKPALLLVQSRATRTPFGVTLLLRCKPIAACHVTAELVSPKRIIRNGHRIVVNVVRATAKFTLASGKTAHEFFKFTSNGRQRLGPGTHVFKEFVLHLNARVAGGNTLHQVVFISK
jgi:hypothetical protein